MIAFLITAATEIASVLYEGSLFILTGFGVAGLLHAFLPGDAVARHLGRESPRSVLLAALFGAPIPLCSCGVLPAAAALRDKGASRSALTAFLISTPETGVDSVALTWALLGPVMAVVRPVVAIVTAIAAGMASLLVRDDPAPTHAEPTPHVLEPEHRHDHAPVGPPTLPGRGRARRILDYAFGTLLDEIAFWLVVGIGLTGVLSALLPEAFFSRVLGWDRGVVPMLAMAALGVPLYLCASASTPVAAALIAKGLSPGAALVFLLTGPATNAATIGVVHHMLGPHRLRIYLASVIGVALAGGLLLDAFAADAVRSTLAGTGAPDGTLLAAAKTLSALVFVTLVARSFWRTRFREGRADLAGQLRRLGRAIVEFDPRVLARPPVAAALLAIAALVLVPRMALVVEPEQRGIVQRFGRVVAADLPPGLHWHLPAPLGRGLAVDVAGVRQVALGFRGSAAGARTSLPDESLYLTADENLIDIRSVVHYRVSDPVRYALGVQDLDGLVGAVARDALVRITTSRSIDSIYAEGRLAVERDWRDAVIRDVAALELGAEVLDARLLDVHAPESVHDAFRDVASAFEDRAREIHDASGYGAERRAAGQGEAAAITEAARAGAVRTAKRAAGATAAFTGLAAVHEVHPVITELRLWLETLERALPAPRKFVNAAGGRGGDLDLWLGNTGGAPTTLVLPESPAPGSAPPDEGGSG